MAKAERDTSVEVRQTIRAPRERVFRAWTQAEEVKKWAGPGPLTVPVASIDLRVGGRYRIEMEEPDGARRVAYGEYREVKPPERLVYSWAWENDRYADGSEITVEFLDRGNATEVVIRHRNLKTDEARAKHREGWTGCLEKLASLF
jgi:uncharacterized protein YndB with AHSA1/START domain